MALSLTGCFGSDPGPSPLGLRVSDGRYEVKIPLCPGEKIADVHISDPGAVDRGRVELLRLGNPLSEGARSGYVTVWSAGALAAGTGEFSDHEVLHDVDKLPKLLEVGFSNSDGPVPGDTFDTERAAAEHLAEGEYWTRKGVMTGAELDRQLGCNSPRS
ncbi:hypothetical protein [Kitasatospora cinereorecta]|uniref:Lipoprotein n=1 Tax=Kitasatospora cinereorecta TaxID=285560 RepID=A0ABW0VK32_9ACTN